MDPTLDALAKAAAELAKQNDRVDKARAKRDDLVVKAIEAGHPWSMVQAKAQLQPRGVAQALERARKRSGEA